MAVSFCTQTTPVWQTWTPGTSIWAQGLVTAGSGRVGGSSRVPHSHGGWTWLICRSLRFFVLNMERFTNLHVILAQRPRSSSLYSSSISVCAPQGSTRSNLDRRCSIMPYRRCRVGSRTTCGHRKSPASARFSCPSGGNLGHPADSQPHPPSVLLTLLPLPQARQWAPLKDSCLLIQSDQGLAFSADQLPPSSPKPQDSKCRLGMPVDSHRMGRGRSSTQRPPEAERGCAH